MGRSLDQILTEVGDGDTVNVTLVSNQDNGIASYAVGGLVFHKATGGLLVNGPPFRPARLESNPSLPFQMFFSDRKLNIDPPPAQGQFGGSPRQPFDANATEKLGMSISLGNGSHEMQLAVFGSKSLVHLTPTGDLLVGLGPSMGNSSAGVFVVSFLGITRPPH
jgi:hypothetical protein